MKYTLLQLHWIYLLVGCLFLCPAYAWCTTSILSLKVQNKVEPLAVEDKHPVFSWQMQSDEVGQKQTAYRIVVTRKSDNRVVWDSRKVDSDISTQIKYMGVALQAEMAYDWNLTVWDAQGKSYTASSFFETGLMNPHISAWDGAEWIGSKELILDAAATNYFMISTRFKLLKGDRASFILGANDFRLIDSFQNADNLQGENYVRVELDLSGVGSAQGAALHIYRVGYAKSDRADIPFLTVSAEKYPETNINSLFTSDNKNTEHTITVKVESSNLTFTIDGKALTTTAASGNTPARFNVGPWGDTHDQNTLPHLASIGFAAMPDCEVRYSGYRVQNCGRSEDNVTFDKQHYNIFETLPNVRVEGDDIFVRNDTEKMTIGYADPSHGALTMLRSSFSTRNGKKMTRAKLYVTAMGAYELFMNGNRVGEDWFAPGNSQYREVLGYYAYDVTDRLAEGDNCIAARLNPGWYTGYMTFTMPNFNFFGDHEALLARLVISYEDGSEQVVVTDKDTWKIYKEGPVRSGSFFHGERYDANREPAVEGWTTTSYNDSAWGQPDIIQKRDWIHFDIVSRYDDPVRVREVLTARQVMPVHSADKHTYVYDMGVNMVGVPSVTIPAGWLKKGDIVIMRYAEQLYPGLKGDDAWYIGEYGKKGRNIAGRPLHETMRAALVSDFYIAKDDGEVTIRPSTTYRGYQYIQITLPSHSGALPVSSVKGLVLSSDNLPSGKYEAVTADGRTGKLVNQLFRNIQRSQMGNFFTIPTDCPQRNERMGWTGDAQAYTRTATYNSDVQNFFRQWMVTLRADQGVGSATEVPGGIGSTVPTYNLADDTTFADGTTWAAAVCMVPWQLYIQYGNKQVIEENMEAMMDWLNGMDFYDFSETYPHLSSKASGLSDWLAMDPNTPADLVNNAIYMYMMEVTACMADAIGRADYAELLRERHALVKEEWNKAYVDEATGKTKNVDGKLVHSQSSYATPLNFNCFSDRNKARAEAYLAELAANPSASGLGDASYPAYTITTGFSGTPNILPALSRSGHVKEAYRMFTCTDFTSWLYPVTKGATSIWERWNGYEVAFAKGHSNAMNSFNHFALGAVGQWMYEYQLGITSDYGQGEAGYKHFVLQPSAGTDYLSLAGSYVSCYGVIHSAWTADGKGTLTGYRATVPANTTATLYLPVSESVSDCKEIKGVKFIRKSSRNGIPVAVYELESGSFEFLVQGGQVEVR